MSITVLRLNHRIGRDKRVTTHLFLAARAFGASRGVLSGEKDTNIIDSVNKTSKEGGGSFSVSYEKNWKKVINEFDGTIVHLTMYGIPVQECVSKIRGSKKDVLVVVGGAKVPFEVYEKADFNVSVTLQPHSEISSLSIFLDQFFSGKELGLEFEGGKKIKPSEKGKFLTG